jgi:hypothetical protein
MLVLPKAAEPLFDRFRVAFTRPTFERFVLLAVGAILAMGRRTTTAVCWTVRALLDGHLSDYHRVFSRAPWRPTVLARVLAAAVLELVPRGMRVVLGVDDTTARHKGDHVYGKGCHRDAVLSTHSHTVWKWGHKWVVLAINVKLPFCRRAWALPVMACLYKPVALDEAEGRRHRTPIDLAKAMVSRLLRWFPGRQFVLLGDGGYASHDIARFARRRRRQLALVSLFHADANLFEPPPARRKGGVGRPRLKGEKAPGPGEVVAKARPRRTTVGWYGGGDRRIAYVSAAGHWYKGGGGLVDLRWVFVRDVQGTHRDQYFYSTDPAMTPEQIVTLYTARWSIEVTFQEVREHLGFETTKQWCRRSVTRAGPCLLGLYSLVTLVYARLAQRRGGPAIHATPGYAKAEPTFSDALFAVRRVLWAETVLKRAPVAAVVPKLPRRFAGFLLDQLAATG